MMSWAKLIFKDRSLKTLADGKSVTNRVGFSILQVLTCHLPLVTYTSREISTLEWGPISLNWLLLRPSILGSTILSLSFFSSAPRLQASMWRNARCRVVAAHSYRNSSCSCRKLPSYCERLFILRNFGNNCDIDCSGLK